MTQDAGLSDEAAREISGYFNETFNWKKDSDSENTKNEHLQMNGETESASGWVEVFIENESTIIIEYSHIPEVLP